MSIPGPGVLRLIFLILENLRIQGEESPSRSVSKDPVRTAFQHLVEVLCECPACVCGMAQAVPILTGYEKKVGSRVRWTELSTQRRI